MSGAPADDDAIDRSPSPASSTSTVATSEAADAALLAELVRARARRALQVADSHAPATRAAYEADWRAFRAWCERLAAIDPSLIALPASDDTLSTYIGALDRRSPSSVRRAVAAIRLAHERADYPALLEERPATVAALRGHARRHARTPVKKQSAATDERIRQMADTCDTTTLIGLRDRALLLVGVDAGLRRSELVAIDIEHLGRQASGIVIRIPTAKGDQTGEGAHVALLARPGTPWCPVAALERWLGASGARTAGPVFVGLRRSRHCHAPGEQRLSDRAVARVVKAAAAAAGLPGDWAGHSLRRGMITTALDHGIPPHVVQGHARHRSIASTLDYGERGQALARHPGVGLGADEPPAGDDRAATDIDPKARTLGPPPDVDGA